MPNIELLVCVRAYTMQQTKIYRAVFYWIILIIIPYNVLNIFFNIQYYNNYLNIILFLAKQRDEIVAYSWAIKKTYIYVQLSELLIYEFFPVSRLESSMTTYDNRKTLSFLST